MDDHEGAVPVAKELHEEIVEDIVEEKLEEKLEDSAKREIVEENVQEKMEEKLEDIVQEKVEEILEDSTSIVEDIVEDKVEDSARQELHEQLEDTVHQEIVKDIVEDSLETSVADEVIEDITEHRVEERLEDLAKLEVATQIAEAVVEESLQESVSQDLAEDIVTEAVDKIVEKSRTPSISSLEISSPKVMAANVAPIAGGIAAAIVKEEVAETRQPAEDGTRMKSVLCALIICLGSFSFGTAIGYPSPSVLDINGHRNPFHLDPGQQSWMGSIITLLALFGGLLGGPCMDILGRRTAIMVWTVPFSIGWIIILASPSSGCMLAGRAVTGLCTGIFSVVCPVYIGEIAPPSIRGLLGSCHQMAVCLGILFIYAFGSFLPWTWSAFSCECMILVLAVGMLFIPESPRWLLSEKRREDTEAALLWLRGHEVNLRWEMLELEDAIALAQDKASPIEFLQPQLYKPLLISLGLMLFQQFSGINVIMFYGASIFEMAGIDLDPNMQNMIVGAVGVVGTLVSVFISDLVGRKVLLVASAFIMALSIGGMGAFFYEKDDPSTEDFALDSLSWLPVTALVLFNFGFNVAFGPVPWLMMSEIFPLRAKALASSVATAFNWLFAFLLTYYWATMTDAMTTAGAYWFCTAFCAVAIPFTIFFVPETKGVPLEVITASFK